MPQPMPKDARPSLAALRRLALVSPTLLILSSCATVGSMMSPYSEKFSCKNRDHGQCIHPDQAYQDAVAGRASHSEPVVTNDRKLLREADNAGLAPAPAPALKGRSSKGSPQPAAFPGYRDSVYRELQGLIDQPVTPMLKPSVAVRTLILPYADRARPDRLYMPRYVYSILDKPVWVVGGYLVEPVAPSAQIPVVNQVRERPGDTGESAPEPAAAAAPGSRP